MKTTTPPSTHPSAIILKPQQGDTFSLLGNIVTLKFNSEGNGRMYEFAGQSSCGTPPLHTHPWDESFYFLEGHVAFQVGTEIVQATLGYVVHLPAGVPHTFAITSPQAKFLVVVSNAAAATYLKELAISAQTQPLSPEAIMAIGQKHNIRPVAQDTH